MFSIEPSSGDSKSKKMTPLPSENSGYAVTDTFVIMKLNNHFLIRMNTRYNRKPYKGRFFLIEEIFYEL